jgi:hypothetical protein
VSSELPDLVVQFNCSDAQNRAEEFQHHLVDPKLRVIPETKEDQVWLTYPNLSDDAFEKITREAHPWCLDRGLTLMQNTGEGGTPQTRVLLVADLARVIG